METVDEQDEQDRPVRVVVVGGGFVGFHALRWLQRHLREQLAAGRVEMVLVNPTDYLLYSPLLPEVATGVVDPRHIAVSLRRALPTVRLVLGRVTSVDLSGRTVTLEQSTRGARPEPQVEPYGRLVLAPGSVTRQFDIPGVPEHARGLKTLVEAVYLRDHLLHQLDVADAEPDTLEGRDARAQLLNVVAVGAGYTGTEFVAQTQRWLRTIEARWDRTRAQDVRWVLVDSASTVLPELGPALAERSLDLLHRRGVDVRLGVTVTSVTDRAVVLSDGTTVPTRTLVWGAGVAPSPLVASLGLPLRKGRLVVAPDLAVAGAAGVWAAGDAAAVPDLAAGRKGRDLPDTPPTAQHAQRQGTAVARNVAASLGVGTARAYRHRDLGLVADLGGWDAVAKPLGIPLSGPVAKAVTRGYHLYALPATANRVRVAADWLWQSLLPPESTQLSFVRPEDVSLAAAQGTGAYGSSRS